MPGYLCHFALRVEEKAIPVVETMKACEAEAAFKPSRRTCNLARSG